MDSLLTTTTSELAPTKSRQEVVREARRLQESLLHSSKGHFAAALSWGRFHLWIGLPVVILSAIAGTAAFAKFDANNLAAGITALLVTALSAVMTFLNPNERAASHLAAGNKYDSLLSKVRVFESIELWSMDSDHLCTAKLLQFIDNKDNLNQSNPQIPRWAYAAAKAGIESGEGSYTVDRPTLLK